MVYSLKNTFKSAVLIKKNKIEVKRLYFPELKEGQVLIKNHFSLVIYANQLLRSIYPSMLETTLSILKNQRAKESEKKLMKVKDIISLIPPI